MDRQKQITTCRLVECRVELTQTQYVVRCGGGRGMRFARGGAGWNVDRSRRVLHSWSPLPPRRGTLRATDIPSAPRTRE